MQKESVKTCDSLIFEGMTSISAVINSVRTGKSSRKINKIYYDSAKTKSKAKELGFLHHVQTELGFEIVAIDEQTINNMTLGNTHGGIIAECTERDFPMLTPENILENGYYVCLDGIEDPYNFGYTVRSLYAAGVDAVILSPRNWMSAAGVVARASAGTSELMDIYICEPDEAADMLHNSGYKVVSAGIRDSVNIYGADLKKPIMLVVGGEKRGISRSILDKSDQIVRIDYGREFNGSLPAAAAASIIAFEIMRQNNA